MANLRVSPAAEYQYMRIDQTTGQSFSQRGLWLFPLLLLALNATAQLPDEDWEFEDPYRDQMLYLHALINYSYDLQWQFDWERRQLAGNGLRLNSASVSSNELLTVADINVNQKLNDKWRFLARASRDDRRQRPVRREDLFFGLERSILESSSVFLMATPQFEKEFIDVYAGYTFYRQDRQQYIRLGVLLEDVSYDTKNELGGKYEQEPLALQWAVRLGLANDWWLYSEGKTGSGFERAFADADASPDLSRHDRRENFARLSLTRAGDREADWSAWIDWYEFSETKLFRQPGFDYAYKNSQLNFAVEHVRTLRDRHRLRFLAHYVQQDAQSRGYNEHDYDRQDLLGGAFYEFLQPNSGYMFAYAFGQPDIEYKGLDVSGNYRLDDYRDKVILGWRYDFSADAQIRLSVSHEVSAKGFGGGSFQFQMFF